MFARNAIIIFAGLGILSGCHAAAQQEVDALVCDSASKKLDASDFLVPAPKPQQSPPLDPKTPQFVKNMEVPGDVPGSNAARITLPANFQKLTEKEKQVALDRFFKSQLEVGPDPQPVKGPEGRPLSLADLQKMAREHSPLLRQAGGDIIAAHGTQIQAGVYNNPTVSWFTTPVSYTSGNIAGPGITQTIVTMGKRKLAESAAQMDTENAKLAYRRAETDLMASVRANYFQVLVNEEGMRANRGLMELTDKIYQTMLLQLKNGKVAPYEPAQIGVFAGQARIAYIQSRNSYLESWKMLATSIGLTAMPATELSGKITGELPRFDFEKSLAHVLKNHTDALTAENGLAKARLNLRLQEVTAVPDVTVGVALYDDNSAPGPPRFVPSFSASVPVPVFDRNFGNIKNAQGALIRAVEQPHAIQNNLTASFADAYRRLEENRQILELYRKQLLPQQVQAFRATVLRHYGAGDVEFVPPGGSTAYMGDLITAEQNLVGLIAAYLGTLSNYWQAVSDTASLLQTDDAYLMASDVEKLPGTDLSELLQLPCSHPCSTLQQPGQPHHADVNVPAASILQPVVSAPISPVPIGQRGTKDVVLVETVRSLAVAAPVAQPLPAQVVQPLPMQVAQPLPVQVAQPLPVQVAQPLPVQLTRPIELSPDFNVADSKGGTR